MELEDVKKLTNGIYLMRWADDKDYIVLVGDLAYIEKAPRGMYSTIRKDAPKSWENVKNIGYLCGEETLDLWPQVWAKQKANPITNFTVPTTGFIYSGSECGLKEISSPTPGDYLKVASEIQKGYKNLLEVLEKRNSELQEQLARHQTSQNVESGGGSGVDPAKVRELEAVRDRYKQECQHERYRIRVKDFREHLLRHWMTSGVTPMKFYYHHESLEVKDITVVPVRYEVTQIGFEITGVCLEVGSIQRYYLRQVYPPRTKPEIDNNETPAKVL